MDEFTKKRIIKIIDNYTFNRIPLHLQSHIKLDYYIKNNQVILLQERAAFKSHKWVQLEITQFRLEKAEMKTIVVL